MKDSRRIYYDHEPAYRQVEAKGGRAWNDCCPSTDHYATFDAFLLSSFAPARGAAVLDLGCGGGQVTLRLAAAGYEATGIDFSETAIKLAQANAHEAKVSASFRVEDCLTLGSFPDATFDAVVDNHVFHCIIGSEHRRAFLAAAFRVLKPGGRMFSETMSCEGEFDPAAYDVDPVTRVARNHTRYWVSRSELRQEFEEQGFMICSQAVSLEGSSAGDSLVTYAEKPRALPPDNLHTSG